MFAGLGERVTEIGSAQKGFATRKEVMDAMESTLEKLSNWTKTKIEGMEKGRRKAQEKLIKRLEEYQNRTLTEFKQLKSLVEKRKWISLTGICFAIYVVAWALAIMLLFGFPVGTVMGVVMIVGLVWIWNQGLGEWFNS